MLHTIQMLLYGAPIPSPYPPGAAATEPDSAPKQMVRRLSRRLEAVAPELIWAPLLGLLVLCAVLAAVLAYRRKARAAWDIEDSAHGACRDVAEREGAMVPRRLLALPPQAWHGLGAWLPLTFRPLTFALTPP